jgi:hypothetical protein
LKSDIWKQRLFKNLIGKTFERLTVIKSVGQDKHGKTLWLCNCTCGNTAIVQTSYLTTGNTKSCGCLKKDRLLERSTIHGKANTRLYRIWQGMKARCLCPTQSSYFNYGGRGIRVCNEWVSNFRNFNDWALSTGYQNNLTIERINNNGNYEPFNCTWIPKAEQVKNRRKSIITALQ